MKLSKKQVKAYLDVMCKDTGRITLWCASLSIHDGKLYLVTTDGYVLAAIAVNDSLLPEVDKIVPRVALEHWYKMAGVKDYLTEAGIKEMLIDNDNTYPVWQSLIPNKNQAVAHSVLSLDPIYWVIMNRLADRQLTLSAYANCFFMAKDETGIYIVCGLKPAHGYVPILMRDYKDLVK